MGGDYAPVTTVWGAVLARKELPAGVRLVLIGDSGKIKEQLDRHKELESNYDIIHTHEVIEMGEPPLKSITQKPNSSIGVGFQMLKNGDLDAFASNGNTGAMMVGALLSVKTIEGIQRPCLTSVVPMEDGGLLTLLDVGSNADCRPEMLCQFASLGDIYAKYINQIKKPRVALLNIGEEEEKGNLVTQAAYQMLKEIKTINFIGNIEGRDIFDGIADVIVCEGFVGNVVLKEAEAFYKLIKKRNIKDDFFDRFNYEIYGGTPILGVNATVVIGHGISNETATKNLIKLAAEMVEKEVTEMIKMAFKPVVI
jgi:glycerol-3-phosphate acyltransferase PlsX